MNGIVNFLKKNWYYIAAVVVVIVVVVIIRRRRTPEPVEPGGSVKPSVASNSDAKFPLQPYSLVNEYSTGKGSMGSQIKTLQMIYNANNTSGTPLDVDGKYGSKTLGAFLGFFYDMIASNGTISESQYNEILKKYN